MDAPEPVCYRCSKPVMPGTASQLDGRPVHMRCLAQETRLASIEQQDVARRLVECAQAAVRLAEELVRTRRLRGTHCPACGERLASPRGVLFQGDQLVHAGCWRADPKPFDAAPPA
jgi:formylmethanofuran dehydrogenase subunit E